MLVSLLLIGQLADGSQFGENAAVDVSGQPPTVFMEYCPGSGKASADTRDANFVRPPSPGIGLYDSPLPVLQLDIGASKAKANCVNYAELRGHVAHSRQCRCQLGLVERVEHGVVGPVAEQVLVAASRLKIAAFLEVRERRQHDDRRSSVMLLDIGDHITAMVLGWRK